MAEVIYPTNPRAAMSGPSLEAMILCILSNHPERRVTAEVVINGTPYKLSRWRDGTIALRPQREGWPLP